MAYKSLSVKNGMRFMVSKELASQQREKYAVKLICNDAMYDIKREDSAILLHFCRAAIIFQLSLPSKIKYYFCNKIQLRQSKKIISNAIQL